MNLIAQKDLNLRTSLARIVKEIDITHQIMECEDWDCTLLELIQTGNIHFLFLDINVLGISWLQRCKELLNILDTTKLILTSNTTENETIIKLFEQGLWSYIPNNLIPHLGRPILNLIIQGGQYFPTFLLRSTNNKNHLEENSYLLPSGDKLTRRQREVLNYLKEGFSNKQIAGKMNISEPTVKLHIHGLFNKFGAINRTQIILKANELGLL